MTAGIESKWASEMTGDGDLLDAFTVTAADVMNAAAGILDEKRSIAVAEHLATGGRVEVAAVFPDRFVALTLVKVDGKRVPLVVGQGPKNGPETQDVVDRPN